MPIPIPNDNETNKEYTNRCMADDKMLEEYPSQAQRYAVCQAQWRRTIKGK